MHHANVNHQQLQSLLISPNLSLGEALLRKSVWNGLYKQIKALQWLCPHLLQLLFSFGIFCSPLRFSGSRAGSCPAAAGGGGGYSALNAIFHGSISLEKPVQTPPARLCIPGCTWKAAGLHRGAWGQNLADYEDDESLGQQKAALFWVNLIQNWEAQWAWVPAMTFIISRELMTL